MKKGIIYINDANMEKLSKSVVINALRLTDNSLDDIHLDFISRVLLQMIKWSVGKNTEKEVPINIGKINAIFSNLNASVVYEVSPSRWQNKYNLLVVGENRSYIFAATGGATPIPKNMTLISMLFFGISNGIRFLLTKLIPIDSVKIFIAPEFTVTAFEFDPSKIDDALNV